MGSFNLRCNLTNAGIGEGDEVVFYPIYPRHLPKVEVNYDSRTCRWGNLLYTGTGNSTAYGLASGPFFGVYTDCGGIALPKSYVETPEDRLFKAWYGESPIKVGNDDESEYRKDSKWQSHMRIMVMRRDAWDAMMRFPLDPEDEKRWHREVVSIMESLEDRLPSNMKKMGDMDADARDAWIDMCRLIVKGRLRDILEPPAQVANSPGFLKGLDDYLKEAGAEHMKNWLFNLFVFTIRLTHLGVIPHPKIYGQQFQADDLWEDVHRKVGEAVGERYRREAMEIAEALDI